MATARKFFEMGFPLNVDLKDFVSIPRDDPSAFDDGNGSGAGRCSGKKPLCPVSSSCLTSIIGREYNFIVQGSMLLGFREQRSQAIAKSKILSFDLAFSGPVICLGK
jgi:hypothetical protein